MFVQFFKPLNTILRRVLLCLVLLLFLADFAIGEELSARLRAAVGKSGNHDGLAVSVLVADSGARVFGLNDDVPLKPASVMKVLTAYTALKELGPEYRFTTKVLAEGLRGSRAEKIWIVGGGDPSLTTEYLWILARAIYRRGIREAGALVLDTSAFEDAVARSGTRAYEASGSALSFNHNSIAFEVCPAAAGAPAVVLAEPWEYPLQLAGRIGTSPGIAVQFAVDELGASVCGQPAAYRVSGTIGASSDCHTVYRSVACPADYLGAVLVEQLRLLGVTVKSRPAPAPAPNNLKVLYVHESKALSGIVDDMNHYSSNFAAEQLLMALDRGRERGKRRSAGLEQLRSVLRGWGFKEPEFKIEDASGLSHANRLSARIVSRILSEAQRSPDFGAEFEKSLSVAERSGTLKKRLFGLDRAVVRAKTGTLNGVTALAGYVRKRSGKSYIFTILQNGSLPQSRHWALEKQVLMVLGACDNGC